jgi:hypothetical protein
MTTIREGVPPIRHWVRRVGLASDALRDADPWEVLRAGRRIDGGQLGIRATPDHR